MSETTLKNKCLKWLRNEYQGAFIVKISDRYTAGIPDIIAIIYGITFIIELKDKGKKPTKLQAYRLQQATNNGILKCYKCKRERQIIVATWVDNFESFKEIFKNVLS